MRRLLFAALLLLPTTAYAQELPPSITGAQRCAQTFLLAQGGPDGFFGEQALDCMSQDLIDSLGGGIQVLNKFAAAPAGAYLTKYEYDNRDGTYTVVYTHYDPMRAKEDGLRSGQSCGDMAGGLCTITVDRATAKIVGWRTDGYAPVPLIPNQTPVPTP